MSAEGKFTASGKHKCQMCAWIYRVRQIERRRCFHRSCALRSVGLKSTFFVVLKLPYMKKELCSWRENGKTECALMSTGRAPGTQKELMHTNNSWICLKTHKEDFCIILFWCQNYCFPVVMHIGSFAFLDISNHWYSSLHRLAMSNIAILVWKIATSKPFLIQGEFQSPED